jgi:hypothetical protein
LATHAGAQPLRAAREARIVVEADHDDGQRSVARSNAAGKQTVVDDEDVGIGLSQLVRQLLGRTGLGQQLDAR